MAARPSAVSRLPWATIVPLRMMVRTLLIVEMGAQRRQPFVPHQHQEIGFAIHFGAAGSKPLGAVFDGVAAVGRKRLAGLSVGAAAVPGTGL